MHLVGLYTYCRMMHGAYNVKYFGPIQNQERLFLVAFAKFRKETISFVIFVCLTVRPSVRPSFLPSLLMKQLGFHRTDFHERRHLDIFRKSIDETQVYLSSGKNKVL